MKTASLRITCLAMSAVVLIGMIAVAQAADQKTNTPPAASTNGAAVKPEIPGPSKFYGPVSAVDLKAKTFTVGDQTFTVTADTPITKNEKPAALTDAVVGEPARGSYTVGKDGKLNVTKVRFGKKADGKAGSKSGGKSGNKAKTTGTGTDAAKKSAPAENP